MHGWENLRDEDRDLILRGIEEGRALGGPFHVELDPVDVCNADCFFCNSAEIRQGAIFPWSRLEPLVQELIAGGLRSFRLAGGGEPLLYKELGPLCDRMAAADVVLDMLTTNGIRLDFAIEHLMKLRVSNVMTSLNYATEESYHRFMRIPGQRFHQVVRNIRLLDEALKKRGDREKTLLHTQFFIHRSTVKDIEAIVELGLSLPVDSFTIRSCGLIPPEEVLTRDDMEELLRRFAPLAEKCRDLYRWVELNFAHDGFQEMCDEVMKSHYHRVLPEERLPVEPSGIKPGTIEYCFIGWYSMLVQGTGAVHPCCFLLPDPRVEPFGNLTTQSIADVWHGPMYQRHREEMRTAMLMQEKTPGQASRFKCTLPFCWAHDQCVLSHKLADWDFYKEAHGRLESLRSAPLIRAGRLVNSLTRRVIETGKSIAR